MNYKEKGLISIAVISFVSLLLVVSIILGQQEKHLPNIESTYVGEVEKCSLYKVKVRRLPPTLLWRCHE